MAGSKNEFDLCGYCCKWVSSLKGKSPLAVRDAYPKMMRKVLKHRFGMGKEAAGQFISDACYGNWDRLHETGVEKLMGAEDYADKLKGDVFYFSDRWSWDRVLRAQWAYMRLVERCERMRDDR